MCAFAVPPSQVTGEDLEMLKPKGTFLVPTVGGIDVFFEPHKIDPQAPQGRKRRDAFLPGIRQSFQTAMSLGVKIAAGFDASTPEGQGKNASELVALTKRGMPPLEAIRAATVNAAELIGWQDRVGAIEVGQFTDSTAVDGDPLADITVLQQVKFVMKGGTIKDVPGVRTEQAK
jgi:imidazolonepropionase-like amidohydrolase